MISLSLASSGHVLEEARGKTFPVLIANRYNSNFSECFSALHISSNTNFSCSFNVLRQIGAILMSAFISKGIKFFASTTLSSSALTSCFLETKKLAKFDAAFCFLRSASNFSSSFFLFSSSLASSRFLRSSSFASFSFCFCLEKKSNSPCITNEYIIKNNRIAKYN